MVMSDWAKAGRPGKRNVKISVRCNAKTDASAAPQLVIHEMILPPGGEWTPDLPGWMVIHASSGVGYWLHPRINCEIQTGAVLVLSDHVEGCIRASQVGDLRLHFFRVEPTKLTELMTMTDRQLLENAAKDEKLSLSVLPPNEHLSDRFRKLHGEAGNTLPARAHMLQIFLELFEGDFHPPRPKTADPLDAKGRLKRMLDQIPISELVDMSFAELVNQTGCSPRHVSRLFTELVGVSFREKQSALRMARARELLATTDSKVVDVALESGYQSNSLFNQMFKQHFGMSPARWREQARGRKATRLMVKRLRVIA
jgi:AraC-like DNA-binding protein